MTKPALPSVFISSALEDLEPYRNSAEQAALRAEFFPVLSKRFPAGQGQPVPTLCREHAAEPHVLAVIAGHRFGWVPEQDNPGEFSITWME